LSVGADDFYFLLSLGQFSQVIGEWLENQILNPDWTYSHCPGATLLICREREKIDWQEPPEFDCWLRMIYIFCCPSSIF